jgi:sulfur-oxidizing protein SoxZ
MARTLIHMPGSARRGEIITIRTLVGHAMETGYRVDAQGQLVPRDIVRRFTCRYNGELVFAAELFAAVAANPFIEFNTVALSSGTLTFEWEGDKGFVQRENMALQVT